MGRTEAPVQGESRRQQYSPVSAASARVLDPTDEEKVLENIEEDDIINKVKNYQPEKKAGYLSKLKKTVSSDKVAPKVEKNQIVADNEEKIIRPTVSDRVVTPQARTEMKDRLEDLLIERIAANPKDTEAYERLGEYYMEIDSLNDAKECFKKVLK